jgi:preprotein translocase subunit SecB
MKMAVIEWTVNELSIKKKASDTEEKTSNGSFRLDVKNSFNPDGKRFYVCFDLTLDDPSYNLYVEAVYAFDVIEGEINEEFKKSHFPKVNAPAIAFPYLRAMVSTITLQAGLKTVMLPSINFASKSEDKPIVGEKN